MRTDNKQLNKKHTSNKIKRHTNKHPGFVGPSEFLPAKTAGPTVLAMTALSHGNNKDCLHFFFLYKLTFHSRSTDLLSTLKIHLVLGKMPLDVSLEISFIINSIVDLSSSISAIQTLDHQLTH